MGDPNPDIRLNAPNPADNAPTWEEDPDRILARLAREPEVNAAAWVRGGHRIQVVLSRPDGRPMSSGEAEGILAEHGLELMEATPAVTVIARVSSGLQAATAHPEVEASLSGPAGPRSLFCDPNGAKVCVTALNRVSLVYFLADAVRTDRRSGLLASEVGWRSNRQASIAVWGRAGGLDPRRLKSLVFNLRAELRGNGVDPWCIEKRRGAVRLRVSRVMLD